MRKPEWSVVSVFLSTVLLLSACSPGGTAVAVESSPPPTNTLEPIPLATETNTPYPFPTEMVILPSPTLNALAVCLPATIESPGQVIAITFATNDRMAHQHCVVQQPYGSPSFISSDTEDLTQFRMAEEYGVIGLLAHNSLAGDDFYQINPGESILVFHADGRTDNFVATSVDRYRALQPHSPYSPFFPVDASLQDTGGAMSVEKVFKQHYMSLPISDQMQLTLQTCIENGGENAWGRFFVEAFLSLTEEEDLAP